MTTSPFLTHRDKVLGHYSTASWLRSFVLSMWNGTEYQVGLSQLAMLDAAHLQAVTDMIAGFHKMGESDLEFMKLADEVLRRRDDEAAAKVKADKFDDWCRDAKRAMPGVGLPRDSVDDYNGWFEVRFDQGFSPEDAVKAFSTRDR